MMKSISIPGVVAAFLLLSPMTISAASLEEEGIEREPLEPEEPRELDEPTDVYEDDRAEPGEEVQEPWPGPGYVSPDLRADDEVEDLQAGDAPEARHGVHMEEEEEEEAWPGPGYVSPDLEE